MPMPLCTHRVKVTGAGTALNRIHRKSVYKGLQVTQQPFQHSQQEAEARVQQILGSDACLPQMNQARPSRNLGQRKTLENSLKTLDLFFLYTYGPGIIKKKKKFFNLSLRKQRKTKNLHF